MVFDGACLGLPLNGTPSSHILKPAISAVEGSVVNEGFCVALAEAMQLGPAKAAVHQVAGRARARPRFCDSSTTWFSMH